MKKINADVTTSFAEKQRKDFGERLKRFRTNAKLTQKQLAEKAKLNKTLITRYETGAAMPRPKTIEQIAAALEIPPVLLSPLVLEQRYGNFEGGFLRSQGINAYPIGEGWYNLSLPGCPEITIPASDCLRIYEYCKNETDKAFGDVIRYHLAQLFIQEAYKWYNEYVKAVGRSTPPRTAAEKQ